LHATINWGDGTSSAAHVVGDGPAHDRVNGLYDIDATHEYTGSPPDSVTVRVGSAGHGVTTVRVPLPPNRASA
jgi:hypothetical protein